MVKGVEVKPSHLKHRSLKITKLGPYKERVYEIFPSASPSKNWNIPNNSINNLVEGVLQRVLFHKENGIFKAPTKVSYQTICNLLEPFRTKFLPSLSQSLRLSYDEVISRYSGRKKIRYQLAAESLLLSSIGFKDSKVQAFIKNEKSKNGFVPRIVSPRRPRYNLELLTYLQHTEKYIFHQINKLFGDVTVFKGMNCYEQGKAMLRKWSRFRNPIAVGFDAVRFDQHVCKGMLLHEHDVYKKIFRNNDQYHLEKLLHWQLTNHVVGVASDGYCKYKIQGGRMSGDVNTALGNSIIMCSIVYSYCHNNSIVKYELANNGDDCVLMIEEKDYHKLKHFPQFCKDCGFLMEVEEPVKKFEQIIFCQTQPILIEDKPQMIRNPLMACSKDVICLQNRRHPHLIEHWLNSVGNSGLSMSGGVPILQEFYQSMLRSTKNYSKSCLEEGGFYWLSRRMNDEYTPVNETTRHSFWKAFGIDTPTQLMIEEYYRNYTFTFDFGKPEDRCMLW